MSILDNLDSLEQLKDLDPNDLSVLCQDLRTMISEVIFRNGGHLASSLGTVELTVSLLRSFDPLKDDYRRRTRANRSTANVLLLPTLAPKRA